MRSASEVEEKSLPLSVHAKYYTISDTNSVRVSHSQTPTKILTKSNKIGDSVPSPTTVYVITTINSSIGSMTKICARIFSSSLCLYKIWYYKSQKGKVLHSRAESVQNQYAAQTNHVLTVDRTKTKNHDTSQCESVRSCSSTCASNSE